MTTPNVLTRLPALLRLTVHVSFFLMILFLLAANISAQVDANASAPAVTVDANGTVHIPPQTVPLSSFLSPEARAYVTYRLLHPCLLYTSPSPRDGLLSRMPSSA